MQLSHHSSLGEKRVVQTQMGVGHGKAQSVVRHFNIKFHYTHSTHSRCHSGWHRSNSFWYQASRAELIRAAVNQGRNRIEKKPCEHSSRSSKIVENKMPPLEKMFHLVPRFQLAWSNQSALPTTGNAKHVTRGITCSNWTELWKHCIALCVKHILHVAHIVFKQFIRGKWVG